MDEQMPPLPEPAGAIDVDKGPYVGEGSDLPHMQGARITDVADGYSADQMHAYAKEYAAALSQPAAAQVDSSHSAGGECGSVQTLTPGPYSVRKSLAGTGIWHITSPAKQDIGAVRSLADASLFAASGDLLEALEWLVDILPDPELDNDELQRVWTKKARAAIAKATP